MTKSFALGPFMIAGNQAAILFGIAVFLLMANIVDRRIGGRIGTVPGTAVLVGFLAARLGYVLIHFSSFVSEPWRVLMIWEGGFSIWAGLFGALATLLVGLSGLNARLWAAGALAAGALMANVAIQLMTVSSAIALPQTAFQTLDGGTFRFDGSGAPMVVNFWASWCPPCRREMPVLAQGASETPDVRFVFANQGEAADVISGYLKANEIDLSAATVLLDGLGELGSHYGTQGLPATLFMMADGTIVNSHLGQITKEALAGAISDLRRKDKGN